MSNRYFPSFRSKFTLCGMHITTLVHANVFVFSPSHYLFLIRVSNYSVMEGRTLNSVVVAKFQWAMLPEVLEGVRIVDAFEDVTTGLRVLIGVPIGNTHFCIFFIQDMLKKPPLTQIQ